MEKQGKYLTPFQRKMLEKNLSAKKLRPEYRCRIRIMLLADEGLTKAKISRTLKCTQETVRYWIGQLKAGQAHNWSDCPIGRPKTINEEYLARLKELATNSPRSCGYSFERWTGKSLSKHLNQELGIEISSVHVNRLLKKMGLSTKALAVANNNRLPANRNGTNSGIVLRELDSTSAAIPSAQLQLNFLG